MKQTISIFLMLIILSFATVIYAANESYRIQLVSNQSEIKPGEELEVTVKIKDIQNISDGIYAVSALIQYDEDIFDKLTSDSTTATINPENGKIVADVNGIKTDSDLFKIKFKVKDKVEIGKTTTITISEFNATDGEKYINYDENATVSFKIINSDNGNSNGSNTKKQYKKINNKQKDPNNANSILPKTGLIKWILSVFLILAIILVIVSYFKYKNHRQFRV